MRSPFAGRFVRTGIAAVSGRWVEGAYELTADLPGVPEDASASPSPGAR